MMFNISGEVNIVEPPIMRYIDAEIQKDFIRHYAAKTTPDRLVVVEPGAVLMCITDEEIPVSARIELTAFLKDWRNYGIRKRIINICDWETDPKFIRVEPKDFSNMSDDEIINLHRFHESTVSGADIAISAYKFGGARHANRIMDIFYKMSKYPVYIDC